MRSTIAFDTTLYRIQTNLLKKKKNWNIFAGDSEYRTTFFLHFRSRFTFARFAQDQFQRFFYPIKALIIFYMLLWLLLYFSIHRFGFLIFLTGACSFAASFYCTSTKFSRWHVRIPLLFCEYLIRHSFFSFLGHTQLGFYLCLSEVVTFAPSIFPHNFLLLDCLLVYVWYYHGSILIGMRLIEYFFISNYRFFHLLAAAALAVLSTVVFGFMEKQLKENWVLLDSFKRDRNLHMKVVNTISYPAYVVDISGRVLFLNSKAEDQAGVKNQQTIMLWDVIHSEDAGKVKSLLKDTAKGHTEEVEILMKSVPDQNGSIKRTDSSKNIVIPQGNMLTYKVDYGYFKVRLSRIEWKSVNCVLVTCEDVMEQRTVHQTLIKNGLRNRNDMKSVCGTLCKVN